MDIPHIMSLKQAAFLLGISEPTMKRRINSKQIKAYKDGGYWKTKREWLLEYQNALLLKTGQYEEGSIEQNSEELLAANEAKSKMHISQFSQEIQDFIHQLCANAIIRAIENGTYKYISGGKQNE